MRFILYAVRAVSATTTTTTTNSSTGSSSTTSSSSTSSTATESSCPSHQTCTTEIDSIIPRHIRYFVAGERRTIGHADETPVADGRAVDGRGIVLDKSNTAISNFGFCRLTGSDSAAKKQTEFSSNSARKFDQLQLGAE